MAAHEEKRECSELSDQYKSPTKNCHTAVREYQIEKETKIINARNHGTFFFKNWNINFIRMPTLMTVRFMDSVDPHKDW